MTELVGGPLVVVVVVVIVVVMVVCGQNLFGSPHYMRYRYSYYKSLARV